MHVHLDPLGGLAGDMFVAALLDAFPEHAAGATGAAQALSGVPCAVLAHRDPVLTGSRFHVGDAGGAPPDRPHAHHHHDHHHEEPDHHHHDPGHGHADWRDIRARIAGSGLTEAVRGRTIAIFTRLAAAEARVHGIDIDAVRFHEVGSADSIADITAAAWVIAALGPVRWSVGRLPLGGGRVQTAHGLMPVPAPATALLLEGFDMVDDGIAGERVTPTGAAILRDLGCMSRTGLVGRICRTGTGFGTRLLPGTSNVLRVLVFDTEAPPTEGSPTEAPPTEAPA